MDKQLLFQKYCQIASKISKLISDLDLTYSNFYSIAVGENDEYRKIDYLKLNKSDNSYKTFMYYLNMFRSYEDYNKYKDASEKTIRQRGNKIKSYLAVTEDIYEKVFQKEIQSASDAQSKKRISDREKYDIITFNNLIESKTLFILAYIAEDASTPGSIIHSQLPIDDLNITLKGFPRLRGKIRIFRNSIIRFYLRDRKLKNFDFLVPSITDELNFGTLIQIVGSNVYTSTCVVSQSSIIKDDLETLKEIISKSLTINYSFQSWESFLLNIGRMSKFNYRGHKLPKDRKNERFNRSQAINYYSQLHPEFHKIQVAENFKDDQQARLSRLHRIKKVKLAEIRKHLMSNPIQNFGI